MNDNDKLRYLHQQITSIHNNDFFRKHIVNTRENLEDALLVIEELQESYKGQNEKGKV